MNILAQELVLPGAMKRVGIVTLRVMIVKSLSSIQQNTAEVM